jgi:4-hydroxy-tetrahydrodipicolinate synthase
VLLPIVFTTHPQHRGIRSMSAFRGLYPPLITPFTAAGAIDEAGLRDHAEFMLEGGSDGFCAGWSTGEFMNLDRAEWEQVLGS